MEIMELCYSNRLPLTHTSTKFSIHQSSSKMPESGSKRFETMQLANGFTVVYDGGQKLDTKGETVTMFGEAGVNAYLRSAGGGEKEGVSDGRLIVDRGVLLFQRTFLSELRPNALSIPL